MKLEELIKYIDWYQLLESEIQSKWKDFIAGWRRNGVGFSYGDWLRDSKFAQDNIEIQETMLEAMGITRYFDVEGHDETWVILSIFKGILERVEDETKNVVTIEPLKCSDCGRELRIGVEMISRGLPRTYYLPCECGAE